MNKNKLLTCDVECYQNYLLIMFKKVTTGKVVYFEKYNDSYLDCKKILKILNNYTIVTFNGLKYDILIIEAALRGFSNKDLWLISNMIIQKQMQPWVIRRKIKTAALDVDHIDLIELAPLKASLKLYAGRLHCPIMKDLPFEPDTIIQDEHLDEMRFYCENDNDDTILLLHQLTKAIELRESMSEDYGIDLRSKSDAQIAEAVIKKEIYNVTGKEPKRPVIDPGKQYYFNCPDNIEFKTPVLQDALRQYKELPFTVGDNGHLTFDFEITEADANKKGVLPKKKPQLQFTIGSTLYTIGIGGLHSCEKSILHEADDITILREYDVAGYYPDIIIKNKLIPKSLGEVFFTIYKKIVTKRLKAKAAGNKEVSEGLKVTVNGSFGKFASKWSCLYAPDLMMHVTVIGQLSLLMLIEEFELNDIKVISANTDGVVLSMFQEQESLVEDIIDDWEFITGYTMEATDYSILASRDVNNYIAVKKDGKFKTKGTYSDKTEYINTLRNNPANEICSTAVKNFLKDGIPIEKTVNKCKDITQFITIRTVKGGAIKDGKELGKAIRWYYGLYELDAIYYKKPNAKGNHNKVPLSDQAVPLMTLPSTFPDDVDLDWYINKSHAILSDIGYKQ